MTAVVHPSEINKNTVFAKGGRGHLCGRSIIIDKTYRTSLAIAPPTLSFFTHVPVDIQNASMCACLFCLAE